MSSEQLPTPLPFSPSNSVSVETPSRYTTFNLVHGDITLIPTELLVISTRGNPTIPPTGQGLHALRERHWAGIGPERRLL